MSLLSDRRIGEESVTANDEEKAGVEARRNRGGDGAGGTSFPVRRVSEKRRRGRGRRRVDGGDWRSDGGVEIRISAAFEMLGGGARKVGGGENGVA
ncbi:hypothetical protein Bca101_014528 [Brassica carinata]